MSVYRRGAVYWWHRQVPWAIGPLHTIKLRMSLRTSDKAEARTRAHALDIELEMVALRYPTKDPAYTREQLEAVFKEALEYKRDQIADQQIRQPYDYDENRLSNAAMARICGLLARSGSLNISDAQWSWAADDPAMTSEERSVFLELAYDYGFKTPQASGLIGSRGPNQALRQVAFLPRYPVAPHFVMIALSNAGLPDTTDNRRIVLATMACAYQQAFIEANEELAKGGANASHAHFPQALRDLLKPSIDDPVPDAPRQAIDRQSVPAPVQDSQQPAHGDHLMVTASSGLIDLKLSQLTAIAIEANVTSGAWQDSARRNAKVISDIFIAVNGDLRMSEIETRHLIALRHRLDIMPTIWGKSTGDRVGGLATVFARGEALEARWKNARTDEEKKALGKIGFSAPTINRHMLTLKQLFDFLRDLDDGEGNKAHRAAHKFRQTNRQRSTEKEHPKAGPSAARNA